MDDQWLEDIRTLFHNQKLAVLSTSLSGHPYTTLVGFAATEDLRRIIFATTRATRKFANRHHPGDPQVCKPDSRCQGVVADRQPHQPVRGLSHRHGGYRPGQSQRNCS